MVASHRARLPLSFFHEQVSSSSSSVRPLMSNNCNGHNTLDTTKGANPTAHVDGHDAWIGVPGVGLCANRALNIADSSKGDDADRGEGPPVVEACNAESRGAVWRRCLIKCRVVSSGGLLVEWGDDYTEVGRSRAGVVVVHHHIHPWSVRQASKHGHTAQYFFYTIMKKRCFSCWHQNSTADHKSIDERCSCCHWV